MKSEKPFENCCKTCQWSLPVEIRQDSNDYICECYLSEWDGYIVNQSHACPEYDNRNYYIE